MSTIRSEIRDKKGNLLDFRDHRSKYEIPGASIITLINKQLNTIGLNAQVSGVYPLAPNNLRSIVFKMDKQNPADWPQLHKTVDTALDSIAQKSHLRF